MSLSPASEISAHSTDTSTGAAGQPTATNRSGFVATVIAVLAMLAAVLVQAGPAAATTTTAAHSRTSYERSIGWSVERMINAERRAHHLPALKMDGYLMASARSHDVTMAHWDAMSHQLPNEAFFATRILRAGYHYRWAGENIAYNTQVNTAGVLQVQSLMYNEHAPFNEHRVNILSTHYSNVGVDVYVDRAHHKIWLTTDFGNRH